VGGVRRGSVVALYRQERTNVLSEARVARKISVLVGALGFFTVPDFLWRRREFARSDLRRGNEGRPEHLAALPLRLGCGMFLPASNGVARARGLGSFEPRCCYGLSVCCFSFGRRYNIRLHLTAPRGRFHFSPCRTAAGSATLGAFGSPSATCHSQCGSFRAERTRGAAGEPAR